MRNLLIAAFAVLLLVAMDASTALAQSGQVIFVQAKQQADKGQSVRVYTEYARDKDTDPLSFDLIIDDKKRAMTDGYMFGLLGRADQGSDCRPFAFLEDGYMDFGSGSKDDRWRKSDLRELTIEANVALKVWDGNDDEFEYRIVKIVDLPAKLPYTCE
jgi:hypothetical protein